MRYHYISTKVSKLKILTIPSTGDDGEQHQNSHTIAGEWHKVNLGKRNKRTFWWGQKCSVFCSGQWLHKSIHIKNSSAKLLKSVYSIVSKLYLNKTMIILKVNFIASQILLHVAQPFHSCKIFHCQTIPQFIHFLGRGNLG